MRVVVIEQPDPVVSWEEAQDHLSLQGDDSQESYVEGLIAAATAHIDGPEGWLGRAIGAQTLEAYLPAFGLTSIGLPYAPAIEIDEIAYVDAAGAEIVLDADAYELRGQLLRPAWPNSWPSPAWRGAEGEAVRIRWRAGYEVLPPAIRAAILLMVGDMFRYRETATEGQTTKVPMTMAVESLLAPFRVFR